MLKAMAPLMAVTGLLAAMTPGVAGAAAYPGNQGGAWEDIAKLPPMVGVYEAGRQPPGVSQRDVKPALTPAAAAQLARFTKTVEDNDSANCIPPGMPRIMSWPYPIEVLFTPGKVALVLEGDMQVRHIYTDGRALPADPDLTFNGTSVGHWEGDTLVVDTVGFVPQANLTPGVPHTKDTRIAERFRMADPQTLEVKTRVENPTLLTKPWEFTTRYTKHPDWTIAEYVCEQNNRNSLGADGKAGIDLTFKK